MSISNDSEFKTALGGLPIPLQRRLAGHFTERVLALSGDVRVKAAVDMASRGEVSEAELAVMYQAANAARVESFTQCGRETDWNAQTGHFVAKAAVNCVRPAKAGENLAWDAAMDARMARTCQTIATGQGTENREADAQYRLLEEFLNQQGNRP